jgi:hypothetical protein
MGEHEAEREQRDDAARAEAGEEVANVVENESSLLVRRVA